MPCKSTLVLITALTTLTLVLGCATGADTVAPYTGPLPEGTDPPVLIAPQVVKGENAHAPFASNAPKSAALLEAASALLALEIPKTKALATAWDKKSPLAYDAQVETRYSLTPFEREGLARDGFVVSSRFEQPSYAVAFQSIFQAELPLLVTTDAILHAIYLSHDELLIDIEAHLILPRLYTLLNHLRVGIIELAKRYDAEAVNDVDLYLAVALNLLDTDGRHPHYDAPHVLEDLLAGIKEAKGVATVTLFGRERVIDYTRYAPRGHYARFGVELEPFFRAVTWLSHLEFNLVSRDSRSSQPGHIPNVEETPREARAAMVLADLIARTGASRLLADIEGLLDLFVSGREDVPMSKLQALTTKAGASDLRAGAPELQAKLKAAIGDDFTRETRLHPMPQGVNALPVITTMLGVRGTPDARALRGLVHDDVQSRQLLTPGDVSYVLGFDHARDTLLKKDIENHPELDTQLDVARARLGEALEGRDDLYSHWLAAIAAVSSPNAGVTPSFTKSGAYRDMELNTAVVGFAQLRKANILLAAQTYAAMGCALPDAYLEPDVAVYEALLRYAARAREVIATVDVGDRFALGEYFARQEMILGALLKIAKLQHLGQSLPPEGLAFLNAIVEIVPPEQSDTGAEPTYSGWYFQLFYASQRVVRNAPIALEDPSFIIDYHTSHELERVSFMGTGVPALGFFVIDAGGAPRLMVGPVARGYGLDAPTSERSALTAPPSPNYDDDFVQRPASDTRRRGEASWATSYTSKVDKATAPPLELSYTYTANPKKKGAYTLTVTLTAKEKVPRSADLRVLDHHSRLLKLRGARVRGAQNELKLTFRVTTDPKTKRPRAEFLRLRVDDYSELVPLISPKWGTLIEAGKISSPSW